MIVHAYYPHDESRVYREANIFASEGHSVDVICIRKGNEKFFGHHNGTNFYRIPTIPFFRVNIFFYILEYIYFFFFSFILLNILFFIKRYKIIQVHNPPDILIFIAFLQKHFAKIVLDVHDPMPEFFSTKFGKDINSSIIKLLKNFERISIGFADNVLTANDKFKEIISRARKNSDVILNLPDDNFFKVKRENEKNSFNIVYHGSLSHRFGVDILLRAVPLLNIDKLNIFIIGEGEGLDYLINLANKLNINDKVHFTKKFIPIYELPEKLSKMTIGVVPTRKTFLTDKALNTKLLEYVAMNIPVISSRTKGVEYYFNDSQVLFFNDENYEELASKILYLYNNPQKREEYAKNARKFFEKYNWERQKKILLNLL